MVLHFFLLFAEKEKNSNRWWIYIIIYLPGIVLTYMEVTTDFYVKAYLLGSNGWTISERTDSMWYWASNAYIVCYVGACILIGYRLQKKAIAQRERKQARILFITSLTSLIAGLIILTLISVEEFDLPDITSISATIWSIGIFYAIVRYKLLAMTPSIIAENLFQTIIDSVVLVNPKGLILSINPETQRLLGYNQKELVGEPLGRLFFSDCESNNAYISELLNTCPIRNMETVMVSSNSVKIPTILSISECKDNYNSRIGFVLVSKDVTEYKNAEKKSSISPHTIA
jgi:PAS domain S-box-containing protein